jgi:hypothetical protein
VRRPITAAERIASRNIPKDARPILEHENGSAAYAYEVEANGSMPAAFCAVAFRGTSAKSEFWYRYRTAEQRDLAIWNFRESVNAELERRAKSRAEQNSAVCTLKVGDIVNTSWGYDQTNVDFYAVTRVSKACVWVRPIVSDYESTGQMSGRTWPRMPITFKVGAETRHLCRGNYFCIDGHSASLTNGEAQYTSSYA